MGRPVPTQLICPECGNIFPIMRKKTKQKQMFHRKWLYCIVCQKETNHIELKDMDKWLAEIRIIGEENLKEEEKDVYQLVKKRSK